MPAPQFFLRMIMLIKSISLQTVIKPSDNVTIDNEFPKKPPYKSTISYKSTVRKDNNLYKLTVTNENGSDTAEVEVVVLGEQPMIFSLYIYTFCVRME